MPEIPTPADDRTQILPSAGESPEAPGEGFRCARCETEYEGADACPACGTLRVEAACETHPDREARGRCVICGRALCDRCSAGGDDAFLCEEHRGVHMIQGWAQVYSTHGEIEAQLVQENLRAEGIDSQIFSQKDHIYPVDLGELSIVRVMVPVWEYGAALDTIRGHMDTEGEVVFACPSCGEAYEPGAEACASCGAPLA
jgi:hypothetical protein